MTYIAPEVFKSSFTCPMCSVIAKQDWVMFDWYGMNQFNKQNCQIRVAMCQHCKEHSLWIYDTLTFPDSSNAPRPNTDMPENVKKLYDEASLICNKSPRGAAALLRLAIQFLCADLGESGKNINNDIKNLVSKGLPPIIQQSLDIVRVTGNDAVHPGQIDTDNIDVVMNLFNLLNIIVEYMISMPQKVSGLYQSLPANKLDEISNRDKTK